MQSNGENVQTIVNTSQQQNQPQEPIVNNPSSADIDAALLKALPGETPLEFVKRSVAQGNPATQNTEKPAENVPVVNTPVAAQPPATTTTPQTPGTNSVTTATVPDKDPEVKFDEEAKTGEEKDKEGTGETPLEATDEIEDVPDSPVAENFKKLRTKLKETNAAAAVTLKEKAELEKRVKAFETGDALPEVLVEKEKEIQRLSKFEKLVDLKGSKEYQDKFIKPLNSVKESLKQKFAEYDVPETMIDQALAAKSGPELDAFLEDNFSMVTALEVKGLITQAKQIQGSAKAAESEPVQTMEQFTRESEQVQRAQTMERNVRIQGAAKDHFAKGLEAIRQEGKFLEVIRKPHDPEYNSKYVDPILQRAAQDYARLVTELAGVGMTELPEHVGKTLAIGVIKAISADIAVIERDRAMTHIDTMNQNHRVMQGINRPGLGGGGRGGSSGPPPAPSAPMTDEQSVEKQGGELMRQIMAKSVK